MKQLLTLASEALGLGAFFLAAGIIMLVLFAIGAAAQVLGLPMRVVQWLRA